jgi:predicted  nucleic acid-binding Zn-ribbon protein
MGYIDEELGQYEEDMAARHYAELEANQAEAEARYNEQLELDEHISSIDSEIAKLQNRIYALEAEKERDIKAFEHRWSKS